MTDDESEAIEELSKRQANWETFHETCDVSLIEQHLAENVVYLPPGKAPIAGKQAILEQYYIPYQGNLDLEYESEEIVVSGDLAVNYHHVRGTRHDEGDSPVRLKALDVFQRDSDGEWKLRWSIWNRTE